MSGPRPDHRSGSRRVDVACFGYLADARVLHVAAYPKANHGADAARAAWEPPESFSASA